MKRAFRIAALALTTFAIAMYGFSQESTKVVKPAVTTTQNLVRGVFGPISSNSGWSNYSVFNLVSGSSLFPGSSTTATFYYGFTAGSTANLGNAVVYTTARGSLVITAATPVTLGGVSGATLLLSSTSVCPTQPLSTTSPCIVRFDPATVTTSPANDYYFVVYFQNNANNSSIAAAQPINGHSGFSGTYAGGTDYTSLTVGQSIPTSVVSTPEFLMYVTNN